MNALGSSFVPGRTDPDAAYGGITQWWFTELDERPFAVDGTRWIAHVCGIHRHGGDLWIQMESAEDEVRAFVVRVSHDMTLDDALIAVEDAWRDASLAA